MREFILISSFLITFLCSAQNKQLLYDFVGIPQSLMLNPAVDFQGKFHIGIPGLSQLSLHGGFSGFSAYDLLADNSVPVNDKIKNIYDSFGKTEFMSLNQQLEILNIGFRHPNSDYISFGYYQELDVLFKFPKDLVDLFYNGNTVLNRKYSIRNLSAQAELLGVFHVGISRKISSFTRMGARVKIYSSVASISTKKNKGYIYTENGTENIYRQHLENVDVLLETSGVDLPDDMDTGPTYIKSQFLLGGDLGLGVDFGFTYTPEKQWEVTGSIQDLGFIYYTNNVASYRVRGSYQLEGFQLKFDPDSPDDYWKELKDDFEKDIVTDTIRSPFMNLRPVKLNGSVSYSFGRKRIGDCNFINKFSPYRHKVGAHLFSRLNLVHSYIAGTLFYEHRLGKSLSTKITYTVDPFSYANIGFGMSARAGAFHFYAAADNLLGVQNVYAMKSANVQLGMNFIFGTY